MGIETEFAVGSRRQRGGPYGQVDLLLEKARETLISLPDFGTVGMYLENGSRLYIDSGSHPELCTPECTNPTDVVRYLLAGEQIMVELARSTASTSPIRIYKHNQDYVSRHAWGCHESYLHRTPSDIIGTDVLSHLVTRIIYTGAGGFDVFRHGPEFLISPRTTFLNRVMTENSTGSRGILHIKDEPHAQYGYRRFHVICGESLSSEIASWLKMATTMLVVAMSDAGLRPGSDLKLAEPLLAMMLIAEDPALDTKLHLNNGRKMSALEIQRSYLAKARRHQRANFMPDWTKEACDRWEEILDLLETGEEAIANKLDWAIKRKVFSSHARKRGFTPARLDQWKIGLREVQASLRLLGHLNLPSAKEMLNISSPAGKTTDETFRRLWGARFDRDELNSVLTLIDELREIDVRFSELGPDGLFNQLDHAGALDHHVKGLTGTEAAMKEPPATGRARLRGLAIRQCFPERERYRCDWQGIDDLVAPRMIDLSEPFERSAHWRPAPKKGDGELSSFADMVYFRTGPYRRDTNPDRTFSCSLEY
jgi:hypothetical protein